MRFRLDEWFKGEPVQPFPDNATGNAWLKAWCSKCTHEPICPLWAVAFASVTPRQWKLQNPQGTTDLYYCTEFEARTSPGYDQ